MVKELALIQSSNDQLDTAVKQILVKYKQKSSTENKKLIQTIGQYINECGGLRKFQETQEKSENERNKFKAFLSASIAAASTQGGSNKSSSVLVVAKNTSMSSSPPPKEAYYSARQTNVVHDSTKIICNHPN